MERLSTERLAIIRADLDACRLVAPRAVVAELLIEIDALTRERDDGLDALKISAAIASEMPRLLAERDKLAAEKATLREALEDFTEFFMGEDMDGPQYDSWNRARRVLADTEDSPDTRSPT